MLHTTGMPLSRSRWGCAQAFIDAHPGRTLQKKWVTERVRELAEHNGRYWVLRAAQAAAPVATNPTMNPSSKAAPAPAASGAAASRAPAQACVPDQAPAPDQAAEPSLEPSPAQAGPMDSFVLRRVPSCHPDGAADWGPGHAMAREVQGDVELGSWKAREHAEAEDSIPWGPIQFTGGAGSARSCGSGMLPNGDGGTRVSASAPGTELAAHSDSGGGVAAPSSAAASCVGPAGAGAGSASAAAGASVGSGGGMLSDAELAAADDHVRITSTPTHLKPHAQHPPLHAALGTI